MKLHATCNGRRVTVEVGDDCPACELGIVRAIGKSGPKVFLQCQHCAWSDWASPIEESSKVPAPWEHTAGQGDDRPFV